MSLKEIVAARVEQRREVERALKERQGAVRRVKTGVKRGVSEEKHAGGVPGEGSVEAEKPSGEEPGRVTLKRYFNE
ncbi:hypothetical protein KDA_74500 [Dictyobacter alpinus]|uniref:Uncharacterized protein n=1 Tax=Dictyobacter alpinus TaxID=2014873 RepID=A0A402AZI7_9CHLR|nr:hypothetical protein KDA_00040 [Dictyobacter alpinus]GCE29174.1 hypothetical protein KDA_46580 [Dictyobacter alpinus]GCE29181.1 hypothetical protein KDA_46650 [Dictyobacter alpinus]GCE31966.1 hypothetical protein KDA_74500 [Dictyobacter alpinus]